MADIPYPLTATTIEELRRQVWNLIMPLYEDDLSGTEIWKHPDDKTKVDGRDIYPKSITLESVAGDLDDVEDGSDYGRVLKINITAGKIVLTECTGDLDDISDGDNYGKVAITSIAAGRIIIAGLASGITDRMFADSSIKAAIEAWRHADDVTMINGGSIFAKSITADKFISTLYGDLNQAMDYVKKVLGAGDEYEHDITDADLSNGQEIDADADVHADYGISIRISTATEWDNGGVWDTGTWDEPTDASGNWTSASMDLGASKTLQMALGYTLVEETPASTTPTIKAQYSTNDSDWGANSPVFDDDNWETLSIANITGGIYKATGALCTFRYFKIKVELATSVTTDRIILHAMTYLGNVINLFGQEVNKTIAIGGTAISLSGFNATPAITVTPVGATPLIPLITAQSSSSVTIKLYSIAGNDVGGNANITIIGV